MARIPLVSKTLLLVALSSWSSGCSAGRQEGGGSTVRDSAGITIVENQAPLLEEGAWKLSNDPILQIGGIASDPEYEFWRVSQVLRASDGRILAANRGTFQVRSYDRDGTFLSAFGTEGEGPGEFRSLSRVFLSTGDSLLIYDGGLGRVSLFDPDGNYAGQMILPSRALGFSVRPRGVLPEGGLLLVGGGATAFSTGGDTQIVQDSLWYMIGDWGHPKVDTIARFPESDRYIISTDQFVGILEPPFARVASTAVHGGEILYGMGDRYEVQVFTPQGNLRRIIRRALAARPLTGDQIESFLSPEIPPGEEPLPNWWSEETGRFDFPTSIPFFDHLLADRESHLWVRRVSWPEEGSTLWDIFDPAGRLLTSLRTPAGLQVHDIGADYMLGVWKDELEVEYLRMYALDRGEQRQ
jgi:hypothetical protein